MINGSKQVRHRQMVTTNSQPFFMGNAIALHQTTEFRIWRLLRVLLGTGLKVFGSVTCDFHSEVVLNFQGQLWNYLLFGSWPQGTESLSWSSYLPIFTVNGCSIYILSWLLRLGPISRLFLAGFPIKISCAILISPMCVTCTTYIVLFYLITIKIFSVKKQR